MAKLIQQSKDYRKKELDDQNYSNRNFDQETKFDWASLIKTNFQNSQFAGTSFKGADLLMANFEGAKLHECQFEGAKLQGANFQNCQDWSTATWDYAEYDDKTLFPSGFNPKVEKCVKKKRKYNLSLGKDKTIKIENGQSKNIEINQKIGQIKSILTRRLGQAEFRNKLIDKYKNRCAITGLEIPCLEAAHVKPYCFCEEPKEKYDIENGLLLRADIHTLFDLGLITIHPETYIVEIKEPLQNCGSEIYQEFHGKKLQSFEIFKPSKIYLEWRWKNYPQYCQNFYYDYVMNLFF